MGETVTFTRQGARLLVTAILAVSMVVVPWRILTSFGDTPLTVIACSLFDLGAVAGIWQAWRMCVTLTPEKVIVRNSWRDYHITWDRIAGIEHHTTLGRQQVSLVLTDGSSVPCAMYRGMSLSNEPLGHDLIAAVQQRLASVDR